MSFSPKFVFAIANFPSNIDILEKLKLDFANNFDFLDHGYMMLKFFFWFANFYIIAQL